MRILGIDPGLAATGYGVLETDGQRSVLLAYGSIATASGQPTPKRLESIYYDLSGLITRLKPDCLAVEKIFFNKNSLSVMQVGEARGVILLCGRLAKLDVYEYTPLQVKQSVAGYGRAEKHQIQQMVKILLRLEQIPRPDDAADALAVALCHAHNFIKSIPGGGYNV